ncbi:MAG: PIN domain-containing protein [Candidatus Melainabacteria bacterium]|nr:PIN domain-containing protein [Candidatus Melainabacteria bacterium]
MYKKVFIDSDVILDFIAERKPFVAAADQIFAMVDQAQLKAFSSTVVMSNIYYLLAHNFKIKNARSVIKTLSSKLKPLAITEQYLQSALDYKKIKDFEDAMQVFCALDAKVDCLITRNIKDYKNDLGLQVFTPDEFVAIHNLT